LLLLLFLLLSLSWNYHEVGLYPITQLITKSKKCLHLSMQLKVIQAETTKQCICKYDFFSSRFLSVS